MGRAFEYRKATKLKRWGHMAKTFTRLGKQIAIAVKAGGPEPENNPALRSVIATCKRENMPKDNIERAIKNALGKDQSDYKEVTYEGYGPHGIAIFVDTLTDNTTRTVGDVRSVFNKFNGTLGTTGSLSFLFDHKCVFTFKKKEGLDMDELILELIDLNVEDEYDEDEQQFIRLADGSLIFEAKILLTDFFRVIDADPSDFGKLTEEVETLAGLLLEIKGDFPRRREIIDFKEYRFQVLEVDNRRILKVKFNRIPEGTGNDENGKDTK